jgi:hypothetical protein
LTGFFLSFATVGAGVVGAVAGAGSAAKADIATKVTTVATSDFILVSFLVAPTFCWRTYTTRQPGVWLTVLVILPNLLHYNTNPCILVECCDATANFI